MSFMFKIGVDILSPPLEGIPSALRGLTSLFGMGRGGHPRHRRHKDFNIFTCWEKCFITDEGEEPKKVFGQLVSLDFDVTAFTSVTYQRRNLRRSLYGKLILKLASRLDAFSAYPFRTRLPCGAAGATTGTPEVRPTRSSRTRVSSSQFSDARYR